VKKSSWIMWNRVLCF